MTGKVALYDATNIDQFQWPETEDAKKAKSYLYPLIKEGISPYLLNVSTKIYLISCGQVFLPFTVNDKEYENSYIASNYYALEFFQEKMSKTHPALFQLQRPLLFLGKSFMKLFKVNKTIFLNNWLMTNSLGPKISPLEFGPMVDFLKQKFPSHTIMFRHVDTMLKRDLIGALKASKFHLLKTREIYLYNPQDKPLKDAAMRKTYRRDLRIAEKYNLTVVPNEELQESDYPRLLALYNMLYVGKYTKYSPQYTLKFIEMTHKRKMVNYILLKKDGVIEGFFGYFVYSNTIINCLFGYDITVSHGHQVYKLLTRLMIEKADELGLIYNNGSGGEEAKAMRGMKPSIEYMGLFNTHLSFPRRFLWETVAFFYKKFTPQQDLL